MFWVLPLEEVSHLTYWARQSGLTPDSIRELETRMSEPDVDQREATIERKRPGFLFDREVCRLTGFAGSHRSQLRDRGREEIIFAYLFGA